MADTSSDHRAPALGQRRILPPYSVRHDFLAPALIADLLAYAQANEARFAATKVGDGAGAAVRPGLRISALLRDFGPLKPAIADLMRPLAPILAAELKVAPFEVSRVELELVAHGDGAFYSRHIDTRPGTAIDPRRSQRLISGVYYFHAMPKGFTGGALRLHEILRDPADALFVDIEPVHNSLVFFPSWMPHEVMKVHCPSRRFADSRFAINCWFHRAAP